MPTPKLIPAGDGGSTAEGGAAVRVPGDLPVSGSLTLADVTFRIAVTGAGRPMVVLHGGPGLGYDYLQPELEGCLADAFRLLFFDQRGSGRSTGAERPERLTMAILVADLENLRCRLGLDALDLLGHSFGGLLALHYAAVHPQRVASLVLVESDPASYSHWIRYREALGARVTAADLREMGSIQSAPGWDSDAPAVEAYYRAYMRAYFAGRRHAESLRLGFDETVRANFAVTNPRIREDLGEYDVRGSLRRISCPTLIVYGDAGIFPAEAGTELEALIPDSRLVILPECGHFPHIEAPLPLRRAILDFRREPGGANGPGELSGLGGALG